MRKGSIKPRKIKPDSLYRDALVTKLINRSMKDGKKSVAQKEVYRALELIKKDQKTTDPISVFQKALENIKPIMEVRSRRIGGAAYQVPSPVRGRRQESLSVRWLIEAARSRPNSQYHTYGEKLAAEITDAAKGEGMAMKKKQDMEKMAEANRAFAHFRW